MPETSHPAVQQAIENARAAAVDRLAEFLSIPSVSTDPAYEPEIQRGAAWVADRLGSLGFTAETASSGGGHPVVLGTHLEAGPDKPTVLFYGHYDVQPPDPIDLWTSPPFEPTIRPSQTPGDGDAIYARGASDDKGQVACFLEALQGFRDAGVELPVNVKVLIEGEEECGSRTLPAFLAERAADLAADVAVVSDTAMWDVATPTLTYGLRGLVYFDIKLHGPNRDLHSGVYGGTLANPATTLARVLGRLFDDDNRITLPGFYDNVAPLDPAERDQWANLPFTDEGFVGAVGSAAWGEAGFSTLERRWARPACDVNGLYGGYMGRGAKTVLPSFAGAKVSFRIPGNMKAKRVAELFTAWLHEQNVGGCRWEIENHGEAEPVLVRRDSADVAAAVAACEAVAGVKPALVRSGATIPVIADFKNTLGMDTLLLGFGLNADDIHSPDEHFGLQRFALGARVHAELLGRLGAGA